MGFLARASLAATLMLSMAACEGAPQAPDSIVFSYLRVEEVGGTRSVVRFTTSIATSCEVQFGLTADAMTEIAVDPDMAPGETAINHQVPLEDLTPLTMYFLRARADDGNLHITLSDATSFSTTDGSDPTDGLNNVALLTAGATPRAA